MVGSRRLVTRYVRAALPTAFSTPTGWPVSREVRDATRSARRPLSRVSGDGDFRPGALPGAFGRATTARANHRPPAAHEHADPEPGLGPRQRRLRRRDGPRRAAGPAPSPAAADGPLHGAAGGREHARS